MPRSLEHASSTLFTIIPRHRPISVAFYDAHGDTEDLFASLTPVYPRASNEIEKSPKKSILIVTNIAFSHIHRVFHTICPEWPACHPQGGGWQATRPVSRVKWLWRHRQTRRNGNVARLDSSNFPTFTSEKYLFGTYRRKIIDIYCPLVTEKSTNPRVKLTCPCLGKPRHGLSKFDTRVSWFLSHHRTKEVDSINL